MAELILHNARIIPMAGRPLSRGFVVIGGGRILAVRNGNGWKEFKGRDTCGLDCQQMALIPGFIDSHFHLKAFAESMVGIDLSCERGGYSIRDIQDRIEGYCRGVPKERWIRIRGYHEFHLSEKRHPTRWDLDKASSIHPIKLTHRTGHAHVLNSLALRMVGITKDSPDPPGGLIDRDLKTGEPTGLLYEMGRYLSKKIPPVPEEDLRRGIHAVNDRLLSCGITSIHEASCGNDMEEWERVYGWKRMGLLKPRVMMMRGVEWLRKGERVFPQRPLPDNTLRLGGVKIILDETTGRLYPPQEELNEIVLMAHQRDLQVAIHAVEEPAVESACDAIEQALIRHPRQDHRHRIEHCSACSPSLARRLASLGIVVATQPSFIYFNGARYIETIRKLEDLYPIGTLMRSGVQVAGGSDCPVVPPDPLMGLYGAVLRRAETGVTLLPGEGISPLNALRMYTVYAARAGFEEKQGAIAPGGFADLVLLSEDPTAILREAIRDIRVEMTMIGGEIVWSSDRFAGGGGKSRT